MGSKTQRLSTPSAPLFGLDIGNGSIKVMQLSASRPLQVIGYGATQFDSRALSASGLIIHPEIVAKAAYSLFQNQLSGQITTRQVALAVPAYRTVTRMVRVPTVQANDQMRAIRSEFGKVTRLPLEQLYLHITVLQQSKQVTEALVVGAPRRIITSYKQMAAILGLEVALIEPTTTSTARLFNEDRHSDMPAVLIDFGAVGADVSVYDQGLRSTTTVRAGGQVFSDLIEHALQVTSAQAAIIKGRYGLGRSKKQVEIRTALEPTLKTVTSAVFRAIALHIKRYGDSQQPKQVIILGGGANMPGLSDYLTDSLRLAVRYGDPWHYLNFKSLAETPITDKPKYATVAGLSLATSTNL